MKILIKAVICLLLLGVTSVYAAKKTEFSLAEKKAIKAVLKKEIAKSKKDKIYLQEKLGKYASAVVDIHGSDGGRVFLEKTDIGWKVITWGTMVSPDDLLESGVPTEIVDKFFK